MAKIELLDQNTINQIAAGEVIERPAAVVKELIENAIDAKANAITVEIKDGGISFIRITDNGAGIARDDIKVAFLRHSTSKIRSALDLLHVASLGFRGEALSSIAAVAQVELVTKTYGELTGIRYVIEGGVEKTMEEIGCPEGTTFLIRNLFYNTPARRKFLKSASTEASYIGDIIERIAISHPNVSFKFMSNNQVKLHTSGNGNLKDIVYNIYGREIASNVVEVKESSENVEIYGYIGKPIISRGNRNYENYYINGRYVKSAIINKAIEEAYKSYTMSHRYPFTAIHLTIPGEFIDVNVHPTKMEIRFRNNDEIYGMVFHSIKDILAGKELIPEVALVEEKEKAKRIENVPEPFEKKRLQGANRGNQPDRDVKIVNSTIVDRTPVQNNTPIDKPAFATKQHSTRVDPSKTAIVGATEIGKLDAIMKHPHEAIEKNLKATVHETSSYHVDKKVLADTDRGNIHKNDSEKINHSKDDTEKANQINETNCDYKDNNKISTIEIQANNIPQQITLFEDKMISEEARSKHRIIGQLFNTYWIVEYEDKMFMIDQHAAHEKVLYEKLIASYKNKDTASQMLQPPIILTLSMREEEALKKQMALLQEIGFEIEHFGGKEYSVRAIPNNLLGIAEKDYLIELIDSLVDESPTNLVESILEKAASMSCKAAVKGNNRLSVAEANALIDQLLHLENPYHCPHGRPTIISMSKYEIEKKFKRIL
ncbi:DNA mismatch repair endonuclease MutL [Anaerosporobacter sp.]|uniref:DNA mismatch repair endonuclease MutL n=1 Tax=Anaerosporobacter sp. TaxID=1872529 RepID=UPI00286F317A|nr:DNA mismatch repair endonuclease MutL [Anaerosporobacter sp.]